MFALIGTKKMFFLSACSCYGDHVFLLCCNLCQTRDSCKAYSVHSRRLLESLCYDLQGSPLKNFRKSVDVDICITLLVGFMFAVSVVRGLFTQYDSCSDLI